MKLSAESFKVVNYGEYREYGRVFDKLVESIPEEAVPEMSNDEMLEVMLYAAIICGWVDGMKADVKPDKYVEGLAEFRAGLETQHPGNVLSSLRNFSVYYNRLRTPDPN